jgi:hypothetical protein
VLAHSSAGWRLPCPITKLKSSPRRDCIDVPDQAVITAGLQEKAGWAGISIDGYDEAT